MIKTKQVGNKSQLMPEGYLLCKEGDVYFWENDTGEISYKTWDRWWVRRDAIFHKKHGYSYECAKASWVIYEPIMKKYHEELNKNLIGECKKCGLCCRENWKFNYNINIEKHEIIAAYKSERPSNYEPCLLFDEINNECKDHFNNKIPICKYWPLLKTDLDQIDCPGYKWKE